MNNNEQCNPDGAFEDVNTKTTNKESDKGKEREVKEDRPRSPGVA